MIVETMTEDFASLLRGHAPRDFRLADTPCASPDVLALVAALDRRVRDHIAPASWLMIEEGQLVGLCSIKAPPVMGEIDIGYGVSPSWWGRGVASRAVAQVLAWAEGRADIVAVTAETIIDGLASQRVLTRNGFSQVGERLDEEDGPVLCWRRPVR